MPVRKSSLGRSGDGFVDPLLGEPALERGVMQERVHALSLHEREGGRELFGERQGLPAARHRLVRISEVPLGHREIRQRVRARRPDELDRLERPGLLHRQRLLEMVLRGLLLPGIGAGHAERRQPLERRALRRVVRGRQPFGETDGGFIVGPDEAEDDMAGDRRHQERNVASALAQRGRLFVGLRDLGRGVTKARLKRDAEAEPEARFLGPSPGPVGQGLDESERGAKVVHGLRMRRPLDGEFAEPLRYSTALAALFSGCNEAPARRCGR